MRHRSVKWDQPAGCIGAGIAESDLGTAPVVRDALHAAVDAGFLTYLPAHVALEAEAACAGFYRERLGWDIPDDRVHLVPDVLSALKLTIELVTEPGSAVIVPTPAYMPFLTVPPALGREVVQLPMFDTPDGWRYDLAGLDAAFADGAGLLVLCNPHNPLGTVLEASEMLRIAEVVERHGGRVFSDEIHAPIVYDEARHVPYASVSPVAAVHTATAIATSKGWNIPGLKAAQIVLTSAADERLWRRLDPAPHKLGSILGAVAARAAYSEGRDWLDATVARFRANRDRVASRLAESALPVGFRMPQATYLAWLDLTAFELGADGPAAYLRARGLDVCCGGDCGDVGAGHVRFNFALEPDVLETALDRLCAALAEAPRAAASSRPAA